MTARIASRRRAGAAELDRRRNDLVLGVDTRRGCRPIGHDQRHVFAAGLLLNAAMDPRHAEAPGNGARHAASLLYNASVSGSEKRILKFCTAAPEAPLIRLSRQLITKTRPRTHRTVTSQKFVPVVSFVPGR